MNSLKSTDVICIIIILIVTFSQTREAIHNIRNARKYDENLSKAYIFAIVIPLTAIYNQRLKAYVTLIYGLILIILLTCIYFFYSIKKKDEDVKYVKKHLIIMFFVLVIIFVIEYLTTFN